MVPKNQLKLIFSDIHSQQPSLLDIRGEEVRININQKDTSINRFVEPIRLVTGFSLRFSELQAVKAKNGDWIVFIGISKDSNTCEVLLELHQFLIILSRLILMNFKHNKWMELQNLFYKIEDLWYMIENEFCACIQCS